MKRRSRPAAAISVSIFIMVIAPLAQAQYGGGTGESNTPYLITTAEQMNAIGAEPNDWDRHFKLTADIDLSGFDGQEGRPAFNIIARDTDATAWGHQGVSFAGVFDGNDHEIRNLTIDAPKRDFVALIGCAGAEARIENIALVNASIKGADYVGSLAGDNRGTIVSCHCIADVFGKGPTGGLVGQNHRGTIISSHSAGSVEGNELGGLVGANIDGTILSCHSTCHIKGHTSWSDIAGWDNAGGLLGYNSGYVSKCHTTGPVTGDMTIGGLIGMNWGVVVSSYSESDVTGNDWVGGLMGFNGGTPVACYSTGTISSRGTVGGLIGSNNWSVVNCYSTATVEGTEWGAGGLVGDNYGAVTACYSTGPVNGTGRVGGLVGDTDEGTVTASFWNVESSGQTASAGGEGRTTAQMREIQMYLDAGWDWVDETKNGTSQIWSMPADGYPIPASFAGNAPTQLQGEGTPESPYLIRDVNDLGAMLYYNHGACYRLEASIDLSEIQWISAPIPGFAGVFDGNDCAISGLTITGGGCLGLFGQMYEVGTIEHLRVLDVNVLGSGDYVGGLLANIYDGEVIACCTTGTVQGDGWVGGLIGQVAYHGKGRTSYSAATVHGEGGSVGGLVGRNEGLVTNCYSTGGVGGGWGRVGGLVGQNGGNLFFCHSSGAVSGDGDENVGGLVGWGSSERVHHSFWDIQTSGRTTSAGGTGLPTAAMWDIDTYLNARWDFMGESDNGDEDFWWILTGQGYPHLWWELPEE